MEIWEERKKSEQGSSGEPANVNMSEFPPPNDPPDIPVELLRYANPNCYFCISQDELSPDWLNVVFLFIFLHYSIFRHFLPPNSFYNLSTIKSSAPLAFYKL